MVDNCARTLTFDRHPERVVTGYQPVLETIVALDLAERVVGRTSFTETARTVFYPARSKPIQPSRRSRRRSLWAAEEQTSQLHLRCLPCAVPRH